MVLNSGNVYSELIPEKSMIPIPRPSTLPGILCAKFTVIKIIYFSISSESFFWQIINFLFVTTYLILLFACIELIAQLEPQKAGKSYVSFVMAVEIRSVYSEPGK